MADLRQNFSGIYDQYIEKIYRFIFLKVNSQPISEDLTSETFLKGWEAFQNQNENKRKIENIQAFLYQIARNAVVDHYREQGRAKTVSADASPEIADPGENAQNKAILSSDINTIKKSIKKLKKEHQDIIIWHYLEDMPITNIAKLLDKPAGTVRVMLHRGLKDLKDIIQES